VTDNKSDLFRSVHCVHGDVNPSAAPDLRGHRFNTATGTFDSIGARGEVIARNGALLDDREQEEAEWRRVWGVA
jgi:hypothetical protein